MKKLSVFFIAIFIFNNSLLFSQKSKNFEGTITYSISYTDLNDMYEQYEAMLPKEAVVKIKGEFSRIEQAAGMGGNSITIFNRKKNQLVILMNIMGQKIAVNQDIQNNIKTKINYLDGNKKIAGYDCKKAEIITNTKKGEGSKITVYYTEDIKSSYPSDTFEKLKGFPMEYQIEKEDMTIKYTVNNVKNEKIPASLFQIPEDYKKMTMEEFKKQVQYIQGN